MSIQPEYSNFSKLLQDKLFVIPQYQRAYSWGSRQRQDLVEDILSILGHSDNREHFMATLVCLNRGEDREIGTDSYVSVDVVDGQQRLTTLLILLKAVSKSLRNTHEAESDKIEEILTKRDGAIVLLQTNHDETNIFTNYLRSGSLPHKAAISLSSDRNLSDAIYEMESFANKNKDKLLDLLKIIKNRLTFVYYQIEDERVVYSVFEVLNSRGLPVDWLDKCKSILMGGCVRGLWFCSIDI